MQEESDASAFERLNQATRCLEKERQFLDALMDTEVAGRVANRIIVLTGIFDAMESSIHEYLQVHSNALFHHKPREVAGVLAMIISEIAREARLCAYLAAKGVFPQALSGLRRGLELIGLYAHIWNDPTKLDCLSDPDSEDYRNAFVFPPSKGLRDSLKKQHIKYRFQQCTLSAGVSKMYAFLSEHFTHATSFGALVVHSAARDPEWSCSLIQRQAPEAYEQQYKLAQQLLGLLLLEIQGPIPKDDLLSEELQASSVVLASMLPLLLTPDESLPDELKQGVDSLFEVLRKMRVE